MLQYLSPLGAKEYLKEDNFKKLTDIKLFSNFKSIEYKQKH